MIILQASASDDELGTWESPRRRSRGNLRCGGGAAGAIGATSPTGRVPVLARPVGLPGHHGRDLRLGVAARPRRVAWADDASRAIGAETRTWILKRSR